ANTKPVSSSTKASLPTTDPDCTASSISAGGGKKSLDCRCRSAETPSAVRSGLKPWPVSHRRCARASSTRSIIAKKRSATPCSLPAISIPNSPISSLVCTSTNVLSTTETTAVKRFGGCSKWGTTRGLFFRRRAWIGCKEGCERALTLLSPETKTPDQYPPEHPKPLSTTPSTPPASCRTFSTSFPHASDSP